MLHGVTVTQSHAVVLQSLMIHGDTVRSTNGILAAVTLTDRIFLIILAMEVELQAVDNLACLFGQSVFLLPTASQPASPEPGQREVSTQRAFAVLQLLFTVGSRHDAEEHTVYAYRCLDDIRGIAFVGFGIEILDVLA